MQAQGPFQRCATHRTLHSQASQRVAAPTSSLPSQPLPISTFALTSHAQIVISSTATPASQHRQRKRTTHQQQSRCCSAPPTLLPHFAGLHATSCLRQCRSTSAGVDLASQPAPAALPPHTLAIAQLRGHAATPQQTGRVCFYLMGRMLAGEYCLGTSASRNTYSE